MICPVCHWVLLPSGSCLNSCNNPEETYKEREERETQAICKAICSEKESGKRYIVR